MAYREIDDLCRRKEILVARSNCYRGTMRIELQQLQASTAWIERGVSVVRRGYPFLLGATALAGFFTVKRARGLKGLLSTGLIGLRMFRKYRPMLSLLRARSKRVDG